MFNFHAVWFWKWHLHICKKCLKGTSEISKILHRNSKKPECLCVVFKKQIVHLLESPIYSEMIYIVRPKLINFIEGGKNVLCFSQLTWTFFLETPSLWMFFFNLNSIHCCPFFFFFYKAYNRKVYSILKLNLNLSLTTI